MASRQTIPMELPAGVVKRRGLLETLGRWVDMDKVRFTSGQPEKLGGWLKYTTGQFKGFCRALFSWNDLTSRTVSAIGTTSKLYIVDQGLTPIDITPQLAPLALTNAFSTVAGSPTVTVAQAGHGLVQGQQVTFSGTTAPVGGLAMDGAWLVDAVSNPNFYTFAHTSNATSTAGPAANTTATYEIPPGPADPAGGYGWGAGTFGTGTFGTARLVPAVFFEPYSWSLSHFGKLLLASPLLGKLYVFDPTTVPVPRATEVAAGEAPGAMRGHFVTPERFVIAYGASPDATNAVDPLLMRWCTQGNHLIWTPSSTNTANSRRLTEGKKIVAGTSLGGGVSLVWTDTALYIHQYTGSRFVFDTRLAGLNAGLAGPTAYCTAQGRAYWFGASAFQLYAGSIQRVPNADDILEWVLGQLRPHFETKIVCFYNARFNEVWWLFVPLTATEPSVYVAHKLSDLSWIHGTLTRTAATALDGGDTRPLLAGTDGWLYLHEEGTDADTLPLDSRIKSGPFQLEEGQSNISLVGYVPDMGQQVGDVQISLAARDRAPLPAHETVTINVPVGTGLVDLRMRGRVIDFEVKQTGVLGGDWSLGKHAFEGASQGRKR